jgi:beta-xylosidase
MTTFTYRVAIPYEAGITRRDPSPVIAVGGTYYVWYSRATVDPSGYYASVWYATSPDGFTWTERGEAIPKGGPGAWDANGVFTPSVLVAGGRYYIFYTAVPEPFDNDGGGPNGTPTAIGIAGADSPGGPWEKFGGNPVLRPVPGDPYEGHRVDDACLIAREGQCWLYYKGRGTGKTPAQTVMCLARADSPTGPYTRAAIKPIIDSGHEVCVFPYGEGVGAIVAPNGPQGGTFQYSPDGLHFTPRAEIAPPGAPGPFRADHFREGAGPGINWGICHDGASANRPFLLRFDCDLLFEGDEER